MIAVRISDDLPFGVAASPAYVERRSAPKTPQELTHHACIRFRSGTGALVPWRFGRKRRTFEVQVDGPLIATEPGIGVRGRSTVRVSSSCRSPSSAVEIDTGRLVTLLDGWVQPQIDAFCRIIFSGGRCGRPCGRSSIFYARAT